ncbi:MAG: hypothetical protein M3410_03690 [Acidobacteriota bacterium]|nr:hypothetical protein [Acidobacteriota bacterium]
MNSMGPEGRVGVGLGEGEGDEATATSLDWTAVGVFEGDSLQDENRKAKKIKKQHVTQHWGILIDFSF